MSASVYHLPNDRMRRMFSRSVIVASGFALLGIIIHQFADASIFDHWGSWWLVWEIFYGWVVLVVFIFLSSAIVTYVRQRVWFWRGDT